MKQNSLLAVLLSIWQPGLGHLYAGLAGRALGAWLFVYGVTALFVTGIVGRTFAGGLTAVGLLIVIVLVIASDAGLQTRRRVGSRLPYQRWHVVILVGGLVSTASFFSLVSIQNLKTYYLPSTAMEPTLNAGDRIVAGLDVYEERAPQIGEIVIFYDPSTPENVLIKRVVATAGDVIEIRDKVLEVNGFTVDEPWAVHRDPAIFPGGPYQELLFSRDQLPPMAIPDDHLFLLGDNRDHSYDSRYFGPVPLDHVVGAPLYVYWARDRSRIGIQIR